MMLHISRSPLIKRAGTGAPPLLRGGTRFRSTVPLIKGGTRFRSTVPLIKGGTRFRSTVPLIKGDLGGSKYTQRPIKLV
ncbi:MAG: hypothetical protein EAZ96_13970 [Oscillatoriales cyanobacterium]|nr:MAG: hypothetical protein EAZ96_13970 [Oscillatoriales cyanobacterium]